MRIVAVTESRVRDPEWREELKDWADKMEGRFVRETPVGVQVTRDWIEYVEELEARVEGLEDQ